MHELSIAESVAQVVARHADGRRVVSVELRVGHLRQVVPPALSFAWELVSQGTPLEGAALELEVVPAAVSCGACGAESIVEGFPLACAGCGSFDVDVTRGEELTVEAIEVEDMEMVASGGRA